jgi:hypothetical protein
VVQRTESKSRRRSRRLPESGAVAGNEGESSLSCADWRTTNTTTMRTVKQFFLMIFLPVKQAFLFPRSIADAFRQRRRRAVLDELEVERLDRIRNPSDYQGK